MTTIMNKNNSPVDIGSSDQQLLVTQIINDISKLSVESKKQVMDEFKPVIPPKKVPTGRVTGYNMFVSAKKTKHNTMSDVAQEWKDVSNRDDETEYQMYLQMAIDTTTANKLKIAKDATVDKDIKPDKDTKPVKVAKPVKDTKPVKVVKPATDVKPTKVVKPTTDVKPAKPAKIAKDTKPVKVVKSTNVDKPVGNWADYESESESESDDEN